MSAPETGPGADSGMFGSEGWHRSTPSRLTVDYPRWWDDDPTDTSAGEAEFIRHRLATRDPAAVERQRREMDAWIAENTAPEAKTA